MTRNQEKQQLDRHGYRKNVGLIVCNDDHKVLWARRARHDGWQFPQGGVEPRESALEAAFRELYEEIGLVSADVELLGSTYDWLRYDVPRANRARYFGMRQFRGQKQRWFLFRLVAKESRVNLETSSRPEFDRWQWVDYWSPLDHIVPFKRSVYKRALTELEPLLHRG